MYGLHSILITYLWVVVRKNARIGGRISPGVSWVGRVLREYVGIQVQYEIWPKRDRSRTKNRGIDWSTLALTDPSNPNTYLISQSQSRSRHEMVDQHRRTNLMIIIDGICAFIALQGSELHLYDVDSCSLRRICCWKKASFMCDVGECRFFTASSRWRLLPCWAAF